MSEIRLFAFRINSGPGTMPSSVMYTRYIIVSSSPGFCTSTHVSKAPDSLAPVVPSARYQIVAGWLAPIESWAAWRGTPGVFQYTERSAITGLSEVTLVDTDQLSGTVSATLSEIRLFAFRINSGPGTLPSSVM